MKNGIIGGILLLVVAAMVVAYSAAFIVYPTQQALVLQFGKVSRPVTEPGLYFKVPFVQNVVVIDKRILDLDMSAQEVIASDRKRLVVDAFARYRITNPVLFYQAVQGGSIGDANARLATFMQSALRSVLADASFIDVVRDQRAQLMEKIRDGVDGRAATIGIKIVDVKIRRADLPEENSQAIYRRMETERQQEASQIRAQGQEAAIRIRADADRQAVVLKADAERESQQTRGDGDAERNNIFATAFGQDPEFFAFYRSMQAYERGLGAQDTRMVLSPDSPFFQFFGDPDGKPAQAPIPTRPQNQTFNVPPPPFGVPGGNR